MTGFKTGRGWLAFRGPLKENLFHKHHALQLTISKENFLTETPQKREFFKGVIISSGTLHKLSGEDLLVILIEAESHLARDLAETWLKEGPTAELSLCLSPLGEPEEIFSELVPGFCLKKHIDERISGVLSHMEDKGPLSLDEAVERACLSKSRFLHLFSEETGVPWRPYLLWKRLLMAVKRTASGFSMTESAQFAGFSDSAHFTRTFKSTFGLTPRQALKSLKT